MERTGQSIGPWFVPRLCWEAWILAHQGRAQDALDRLGVVDGVPSDVARPFADQVRASVIATEAWEHVPALLNDSRAYAAEAGLRALPVHLDRLEGRAALAAGDLESATRLLSAASDGFARLGARWEQACTDLDLARALAAAERKEEARARLEPAIAVFEDLSSLRELEHSGQLLGRLV